MKKSDAELIVNYFVNSDHNYLKAMGADKTKLPNKEDWVAQLKKELEKPNNEKEIYYVIWLINDQAIGHSNINQIEYGSHATMHLHIWESANRKNGNGLYLLKQSIPYYFEHFKLKKLICEPYAQNLAPTKVLEKIGYEFVEAYDGYPGAICFYQTINKYEMTKELFHKINYTQK